MSSNSEMIRHLLTRFRGLKPKEIERLLGERGVKVDAILIGVARLRHRRADAAEERWRRLLAKLLLQRPDLLEQVQASDEALIEITRAAASLDGLPDDELLEALATNIPRQEFPASESAARVTRVFSAVLDRRPEYRRAIELATGCKPGSIRAVGVRGDLERLATDEEIEAVILHFLDGTFPVGPTAEAVARAALSRDDEIRRDAERGRSDRAAKVCEMVAAQVRPDLEQHAKLLLFVRQFVEAYPDWSDEVLADWLIARMKGDEDEADGFSVDLQIEGLTIRPRPQ